nr:unnamed protein product [Callosobruchus chinensis]
MLLCRHIIVLHFLKILLQASTLLLLCGHLRREIICQPSEQSLRLEHHFENQLLLLLRVLSSFPYIFSELSQSTSLYFYQEQLTVLFPMVYPCVSLMCAAL